MQILQSKFLQSLETKKENKSSATTPKVVGALVMLTLGGVAYGHTVPASISKIKSSDKQICIAAIKTLTLNNSLMSRIIDKARKSGFEIPNSFSTSNGETILEYLNNKSIIPHFVNPSQTGGLIIEFFHSSTYFMIDIGNDEDIVVLTNLSGNRKAWDLKRDTYISKLDELIK